MRAVVALVLAISVGCTVATPRDDLEALLEMARSDPERLHALIVQELGGVRVRLQDTDGAQAPNVTLAAAASGTPIVTAHGMGDSCFEPGFSQVTKLLGQYAGAFATCVPTGSNIATDTVNGYLLGLSESIDRFADGIRSHPELANGFDAVGLSQGNILVRGYIQRYNNPPVRRWLSIHGTVVGVAAVPQCQVGKNASICKSISHFLGVPAYTSFVQNHIFQAGYLRDPQRVNTEAYRSSSVIGMLNNEGDAVNATYKTNFESVERMIFVEATADTMIEPREGEQWGLFDASFGLLSMNQTELYKQDLFGLRTLDEQKKIAFEYTPGNHLEFARSDLQTWVTKYLSTAAGASAPLVV